MKGPRQPEWLERLETEHDNLRAALSRLIEQAAAERAVRVVEGLWLFWWLDGYLEEAGGWMEQLLAVSGALAPRSLGLLTGRAGMLAFRRDRGDARARSLLEDSLARLQDAGEPADLVLILASLAQIARLEGDHERAAELLDRALGIARSEDLPWEIALMLNFRGQTPFAEERFDEAIEIYEAALENARKAGAQLGILLSLYNLALAHERRGDAAAAQELLEEGLSLAVEIRYDTSTAHFLRALAVVAADGDAERAGRLDGAAERMMGATGGSLWPRMRAIAAASPLRSPEISDEAFTRGRAEGRRMHSARVVEYALASGE